MAMTNFNLVVDIEVAENKGEDDNLIQYYEQTQTFLIGVFDGLGGRSAGFGGQTGGQIASKIASEISKNFFKQWHGQITLENAIQLQQEICQSLKHQADMNMPKTSSRLKGSLVEHKLCTTIALASIPKQKTQEKIFEVNIAWMGDSRIYFLSPTKGLQQLTKDDLVTPKDAFEMLRQDPPMSQYLTADMNPRWQIHFQHYQFQEIGCFLACTDGCFQYVSAPWEFEKLLLETLSNSEGDKMNNINWRQLIDQKYTEIKQDDISLIIYPVGFHNVKKLKTAYQDRLYYLQQNFNYNYNNYHELTTGWERYKIDYEYYLGFITETPSVTYTRATEETSSALAISSDVSKIDQFKQITNSSKQKAAAKEEEINNLLDRAKSCYRNYRFPEAENLCNQVLRIEPHETDAKYLLGLIYLQLANERRDLSQKNNFLETAAANFKEVIQFIKHSGEKLEEKLVESCKNLGNIYYDLKNWDEAVEYYQKFFSYKNSQKTINSVNLNPDLQQLEFFIFALEKSRLNKKDEPANIAIQFCLRIINNLSLHDGTKPLIYWFMSNLQEIQEEFNAALNSLKIALESPGIDYSTRQKAQQKQQNISHKSNYRRY